MAATEIDRIDLVVDPKQVAKLPTKVQKQIKDLTFSVERFDTEKCADGLTRNKPGGKSNRPQRSAAIKRLALTVLGGEWEINGSTIVFDNKDRLTDGQHRHEAVVSAGKTDPNANIWSMVVRGVHPRVFETIDQGLPRTIADVLSVKGEDNAKELAVAVRLLWIRSNGKKVAGGGALRPAIVDQLLQDHPGLVECVTYVLGVDEENEGILKGLGLSLGYLACMQYLFSVCDAEIDENHKLVSFSGSYADYSDHFVTELATGEKAEDSISKSNAAVKLRNKIIANRGRQDVKLTRDGLCGLIVKSMLAFAKGSDVNRLDLKDGENPRLGGLDFDPKSDTPASQDSEAEKSKEAEKEKPKRRRKKKDESEG